MPNAPPRRAGRNSGRPTAQAPVGGRRDRRLVPRPRQARPHRVRRPVLRVALCTAERMPVTAGSARDYAQGKWFTLVHAHETSSTARATATSARAGPELPTARPHRADPASTRPTPVRRKPPAPIRVPKLVFNLTPGSLRRTGDWFHQTLTGRLDRDGPAASAVAGTVNAWRSCSVTATPTRTSTWSTSARRHDRPDRRQRRTGSATPRLTFDTTGTVGGSVGATCRWHWARGIVRAVHRGVREGLSRDRDRDRHLHRRRRGTDRHRPERDRTRAPRQRRLQPAASPASARRPWVSRPSAARRSCS